MQFMVISSGMFSRSSPLTHAPRGAAAPARDWPGQQWDAPVKTPPETLEALAKTLLARELKNGPAGAAVLVADHGEDAFGIDAVGDELGIFFGDAHVGEEQGLLHFVDCQPEAARPVEHVAEQREALGATGREEVVERGAQTIPAGHHMAVLAPGEDPGNGAQILNTLGAEAARRTRADLEERQFLDRACRMEIIEQGLVLRQPAIGLE